MGTYGPGEIAELCSWLEPTVSVITAIGPVHLERFGSEDRILDAKAEILASGATTAVLNVDDPRLSALARTEQDRGRRVRRVSGGAVDADVSVRRNGDGFSVSVDAVEIGAMAFGPQPTNVAAAVAVALELGVPAAEVAVRLATLPTAPHRLEPARSAGGVAVLDDTYNANPAGARAALDELVRAASEGARRVVVTPGMIELGSRQVEENTAFARAVATVADDLLIVGRTNRKALLAGAGDGVRTTLVDRREEAVAWVKEHLGAGDIVLYENDLPDNYP
jgi:UDP-N-acetylmuramoyl-tripeptide--D-alanyl-D-alanine ligase